MSTHSELIQLRKLVEHNPDIEFMCHVADDHGLYNAVGAISSKIKSYNQDTSCLINIYNGLLGTATHHSSKYQTYRLEWLDKLIEEYK